MNGSEAFTLEDAQNEEPVTDLATITQIAHEFGDEIARQSAFGYAGETIMGEQNVYKAVEPKLANKTAALTSLIKPGLTTAADLIPDVIAYRQLSDGRSLVVQKRIEGRHPVSMDDQLITEVLSFIDELQTVRAPQVITDFEGTERPVDEYWIDTTASAQKFADKILAGPELPDESARLIEQALEEIARIAVSDRPAPSLVVVHKDIHEANLLIDDEGHLAGVLDWDAAQMAPRELEYAVLWQRFPGNWPNIGETLRDKPLDRDVFVAAGLTQILRFWKSFPYQADFVQKQIDAMTHTLELAHGEPIDGITTI